jgi:hypothetical protein
VSESYDAQFLYDCLGEKEFFAFGGTSKTVVELGVDKNKIKAAIANGLIPDEVVNRARKLTNRYKRIEQVVL